MRNRFGIEEIPYDDRTCIIVLEFDDGEQVGIIVDRVQEVLVAKPTDRLDRTAGGTNTLSFSTSGEGKNGVYSSEQGKYVATAVLDGSLTVRVYDVDSGELIATEVVENANSTYFNRIPKIYLLDEAKTAVVLLGGSINELDTLVSTFTFGE